MADSRQRAPSACTRVEAEGRQRPLELRYSEALTLLFDMALESAMRIREMYTLERGQIDLERPTIFLSKTKNGSKRQVPMSSVLVAKLTAYGGGSELHLFRWWGGNPDK
ncbi:tyrosine-type recombinase/integrase [Stenotrophomonas chelatiphaga]|uniref:tyrosine-type recombinase/integrase n=1 Tax=Stenotrophomonas chelatiphaga TaxID=517011 RepID=UPI00289E8AE9|nr:tyrosine-type recombinase/integrase [Stenotrophomonas chelatiphaga]